MGEGIHFERGVEAPDGIHDGVEKNEYRTTNAVALALIGKSALEDWQRAITGMAEVAMSELG